MSHAPTRRDVLRTGLAAGAGFGLSRLGLAAEPAGTPGPVKDPKGTADTVILVWLPGGIAQTDTWDPKKFTPFAPKMKGSEILGTCESVPTSADGIRFGAGLETVAKMMHKGSVVRSLTNETKFGAIHLKAQYYMKTGYLFPAGVKAPSLGAIVARTLGRKNPQVPAFIDIGRDINTSNEEYLFINEYSGPGFYGVNYAPFMIPEPAQGLATLNAVGGMPIERLDRRQAYLAAVAGLAPKEIQTANKAHDYMKVMADARAMMDSPVKKAFDFAKEEKEETLKAYDVGHRFGPACLLARRLVEIGARFVEVEYQYQPFGGFDMHENGKPRMIDMKKHVDRPIGTLLKELDERGLLERTLVVIATEFGRTVADKPAAGTEPDGFVERSTGEGLVIESEKMYGFHGHFSSCSSMLFFGGGIKGGTVYGKTAERHPMIAVENAVQLPDLYATILNRLGIPPDLYYVTEGRPVYVTKDGKGKAVREILA